MLQQPHGSTASALDAIAERSPSLATALDLIEPIRVEGYPKILTDDDVAHLREIIGAESVDPKRQFQSGVRFEVPQGFEVDKHREALAAVIQKVLDARGEVLTRANTSW